MADESTRSPELETRLQVFSGELIDTIRTVVREELAQFGGAAPASAADPAAGIDLHRLAETPEFRKEVNGCMEKAFQTVLPQLIKRFKEEIEERLREAGGGPGGGAGVDLATIANSDAMKEMLDGRFRQMMLYLKQDIIPKAIEQRMPVT